MDVLTQLYLPPVSFHAMSMISGFGILKKRTQAVIMVGAKAPQYARAMGYIPVATFDEAKKMAERFTGKNPRYLATPECFSGGVPVHLFRQGQKPD